MEVDQNPLCLAKHHRLFINTYGGSNLNIFCDLWSPFTDQKGPMKRCCGVNRKHASSESGIWTWAFKHHRKMWNRTRLRLRFQIFVCCFSQISNFTLCRSVFALQFNISFQFNCIISFQFNFNFGCSMFVAAIAPPLLLSPLVRTSIWVQSWEKLLCIWLQISPLLLK